MRLWSIHPCYLDTKGLLAVWREGLLAQSVLLQEEYKECPKCIDTPTNKIIDRKKYMILNPETTYCSKCHGTGKIKTPYYMHPQLERFKNISLDCIYTYLHFIYQESLKRHYNFDINKLKKCSQDVGDLPVTIGQLEYEWNHLQRKLKKRNINKYIENSKLHEQENFIIKSHPLFEIINGEIESWERIKK